MRFRILAACAAVVFAFCVFSPTWASAQLDISGYAGGGLGSSSMDEACGFRFTAPEDCGVIYQF